MIDLMTFRVNGDDMAVKRNKFRDEDVYIMIRQSCDYIKENTEELIGTVHDGLNTHAVNVTICYEPDAAPTVVVTKECISPIELPFSDDSWDEVHK